MFRQIFDVLLHLLRSRGAVQTENVNRERFQDGDNRCNVGTHQHRAGGFHRHRDHQGSTFTTGFKCILDALQRRLDLKNVLTGLNDEQIYVASKQSGGLIAE